MEALTINNRNLAVARREILAKPELVRCLNGQELDIYKASAGKTLGEYNNVELTKGMNTILWGIANDVGYKITDQKIWGINVARIVKYLSKYFANYSVQDIEMAFELLVVGELDEYLPKTNGQPDRSHYQQFNADYFFKILNAYNRMRAKVISKVVASLPEDNARQEDERRRQTERAKIYNRQRCIETFLEYKYTGRLNGNSLEIMLYCDMLSKCGLIAENVRIGDKEQIELLGVMADKNKLGAYGKARKRKLKEIFDWMIKEEIQIADYLNVKGT